MGERENPKEYRYYKEHDWVRMEADGSASIGITDHAQEQLGDIVFVYIPEDEKQVEQFKMFGEIESPKAVSELYSPVSGQIIEVNQGVLDHPEIINEDPYGEGWIIRVTLKDPSELEGLMSAEQYEAMVATPKEDS